MNKHSTKWTEVWASIALLIAVIVILRLWGSV